VSFCEISSNIEQTILKMYRIFTFRCDSHRHLGILKFWNFIYQWSPVIRDAHSAKPHQNCLNGCWDRNFSIFIDCVAGVIIRLIASVCVHVCVSISCGHSPVRTVWPLTLIFGMKDLDQGHRSKVKVKHWKLFTLSRVNQCCGAD